MPLSLQSRLYALADKKTAILGPNHVHKIPFSKFQFDSSLSFYRCILVSMQNNKPSKCLTASVRMTSDSNDWFPLKCAVSMTIKPHHVYKDYRCFPIVAI